MPSGRDNEETPPADRGRLLRPQAWRRADRHILLGVSHASNDPTRHRVFEVRAVFDDAAGGWVAHVAEQNLNEQRGDWGTLQRHDALTGVFPSAASCLGHAVTTVITLVDRDA